MGKNSECEAQLGDGGAASGWAALKLSGGRGDVVRFMLACSVLAGSQPGGRTARSDAREAVTGSESPFRFSEAGEAGTWDGPGLD